MSVPRLTGYLALALLALSPAFSQQPGGTNTPPSGGSQPGSTPPPGGSVPPASPGRSIPQPEPTFPQEMERPIFLSGRVVTDAGAPPSETVAIESVCTGIAKTEAYTDKKGRFSFQLGDPHSGVFQDASVGSADAAFGRMGRQNPGPGGLSASGGVSQKLRSCELQARLPGYRSDVIVLATRRANDNPDLGVIVLHQMGQVEGRTISASNLAAPKDARKALEKGMSAFKKNKAEDALQQFEKATQLYPEYASAWSEMGVVQSSLGQSEKARESFQKAINADAKYIQPYLHLALIETRAKDWPKVLETTAQIIKLDPYDYPQAFLLNAVAHFNMGNADAAEKSAKAAEKLDTRQSFPKTFHLLSAILANRRDFAGAVNYMRTYLKLAPNASDADAARDQLAQWEKLSAESLANK